jgi:hypothetical protein
VGGVPQFSGMEYNNVGRGTFWCISHSDCNHSFRGSYETVYCMELQSDIYRVGFILCNSGLQLGYWGYADILGGERKYLTWIKITAVEDPPHWPCDTSLSAKLALTSPTSGGRSVGIVLSRTKATELESKRNTGTAWTLNQLWSSHSRRFVTKLRCWHARNKLNQLISRSEHISNSVAVVPELLRIEGCSVVSVTDL